MASKKKILDQNRRDAMYWAEEWRIKQRRRRIFTGIGAVIAVVALGFLINYISILGSRMVFSSEEEMREISSWISELTDVFDGAAGSDITLHISRFFPRFHMTDRPATSVEKIYRLRNIAKEKLNFVYTGNC